MQAKRNKELEKETRVSMIIRKNSLIKKNNDGEEKEKGFFQHTMLSLQRHTIRYVSERESN